MRRELTRRLERPGLRFGRLSVSSRICLVILAVVALAAIFAPLLAGYSPTQTGLSQPTVVDGINVPFHAPDGDFWFGTDNSGRDIFPGCSMGLGAHSSSAWALLCWLW